MLSKSSSEEALQAEAVWGKGTQLVTIKNAGSEVAEAWSGDKWTKSVRGRPSVNDDEGSGSFDRERLLGLKK